MTIEFLRTRYVRKEDRIRRSGTARTSSRIGRYPLGHGARPSDEPWHDKATGKTFLRYKDGKCLHYYFYFIDPMLGLCYLRVPTWPPFRLQVYFNGHNLLAHKLDLAGIGYRMIDIAFVAIDDWSVPGLLAKTATSRPCTTSSINWHAVSPCDRRFRSGVHWCLTQVEYATDWSSTSRTSSGRSTRPSRGRRSTR